jgi:hypothetical protein
MLDRPLAPSSYHYCKILSVRPVAAPYAAAVNFRVEGFNLVSDSSRYFIIELSSLLKKMRRNLYVSFILCTYNCHLSMYAG